MTYHDPCTVPADPNYPTLLQAIPCGVTFHMLNYNGGTPYIRLQASHSVMVEDGDKRPHQFNTDGHHLAIANLENGQVSWMHKDKPCRVIEDLPCKSEEKKQSILDQAFEQLRECRVLRNARDLYIEESREMVAQRLQETLDYYVVVQSPTYGRCRIRAEGNKTTTVHLCPAYSADPALDSADWVEFDPEHEKIFWDEVTR